MNREALAAIGQYAAANPEYPMNLHGDVTLCWLYNQISANRQSIHTSPCSAETLAARGPGSDRATTAHYATPECMKRIFSTWYGRHEHSKAGIRT